MDLEESLDKGVAFRTQGGSGRDRGVEGALSGMRDRFTPDFRFLGRRGENLTARPWVLHRRVGPREVYMVVGAPRGSDCFFRAKGRVELWDPWTGRTGPLWTVHEEPHGTVVRMPLEASEAQTIVFGPGEPGPLVTDTDLEDVTSVERGGGRIVVLGATTGDGPRTAVVLK